MRFPPVPKESRNQIKKAGQTMIDRNRSAQERAKAIELVDRFRAAHVYPINTFQITLGRKLKSFPNSFMAQRLKRLRSIMGKLRKERNMKVTTMQDIAGLRAVVNSVKDVYVLERTYAKTKFEHIFKSAVDYIAKPRDSGYRGLHLIYYYRSKRKPEYDGLILEIQVRTKLQHSWATAVEITELLVDQPLKASIGSKEWLDFFAIVSSAFACLEGKPTLAAHSHLPQRKIFERVKTEEALLNVRRTMKGLPLVAKYISQSSRALEYHLVEQDFDKNVVRTTSYAATSLQEAVDAYAKAEAGLSGTHKNVVLVSAADLKKAYPNLYLDSREFIKNLEKVISLA